jgi:signal transduction histidine kinase
MEAVGRLAGGIAHAFNNLLTIVNGCSDIVVKSPRLNEDLQGPVEEVLQAGDRAAAFTNQLLAFSRHQIIKSRVLDFNEVITENVQMLGRLIEEDIPTPRTCRLPSIPECRSSRESMKTGNASNV